MIQTALDQSLFVRAAVDGVIFEAILAACLTALMILLFLGSWRSTLIIAVSIPLSILTSIAILSALGETINIMTLGGLALAVGILVDDATVAIENINQHLEQGKGLEQAILDGAQQIAVPTFVSTLCICIVFVPMFLLTGVARYLFVPLAMAVVFAMLASYFFSRTLVPTLAKYLLRGHEHDAQVAPGRWDLPGRLHVAFEAGFARMREGYRNLLARCLSAPVPFIGTVLAGCIVSVALVPWVGRDFFPTVDAGQFKLHLRARTGTRLEETARLCDLVERRIRSIIPESELETILDNIGLPTSGTNLTYNNSGTIGPADADIIVSLKKGHRPTQEYIRTLRAQLPLEFPGVTFYFLPADIVSQILNFGLPAPIDIQVIGRTVEENREFAVKLLERLKGVEGIADLRIQQPFDQPKLDVTVDRTKAQQAGFSLRDVGSNLLITLSGSFQTNPTFFLNPKNNVTYQVITQAPQYRMDSLQALANIPLSSKGASRHPGQLRQREPRHRAGGNQSLERAAGDRPVRRCAGPRPGWSCRRRHENRRRQHEGPAEGLAPDHARADGNHALVVQRAAVGAGVRHRSGVSANGGELPVLARPLHHHHRVAGGVGRHRVDAVRHPDHHQRAGAHRRHHGHGDRHGQQHSDGELRARAPARRGRCDYRGH
jgi:multidrug efflux pump subunit AcrB